MDITGHPSKYVEKASAFNVADMRTSLRLFLLAKRSLRMISKKSVFKSLS